jgi:sphingolipid delta-4 desaturase
VWYFLGLQALLYLAFSTLLGMGLHPMAGHFVAEHYTFQRGQETYSYYGPLNWFSHNVGYHNEHHDFPFIPGCRLRQLRELAPEFYDPLPSHASWVKVIWCYIFDPAISPFSRVIRNTMSAEEVAAVVAAGAMN